MKVLILGATGHLGSHITYLLSSLPSYQVTHFSRCHINDFLLNPYRLRFDIIINCAAVVGHRKASSLSLQSLMQINATLPMLLVHNSLPYTHYIHISSNSVFEDSSELIKLPSTPVNCSRNYSLSKYLAEVLLTNCVHSDRITILRLPQLYSTNFQFTTNFLTGLLFQINHYKSITVTQHHLFSILSVNDACNYLLTVINQRPTGIQHISDPFPYSWLSFKRVLEKAEHLFFTDILLNDPQANLLLSNSTDYKITTNIVSLLKTIGF